MTTPRLTPFHATTPRARVFSPFVIISDSDDEITTLPVRPAPPSLDHTPSWYGYPLNSGDDSSNENLSETVKSLHTQTASTSVVHLPPTQPLLLALPFLLTNKGDLDATRLHGSYGSMENCITIYLSSTTSIRDTIIIITTIT
ncbi:hypothetical protein Tco_0905966, partial [Tanacetum coccineum]